MNKQIEEMARAVCRLPRSCAQDCIHSGECKARIYARRAIEAGYRKASEVAKEIIQEVRNAWANSWTESEFLEMLKDIEKKYEVTDE